MKRVAQAVAAALLTVALAGAVGWLAVRNACRAEAHPLRPPATAAKEARESGPPVRLTVLSTAVEVAGIVPGDRVAFRRGDRRLPPLATDSRATDPRATGPRAAAWGYRVLSTAVHDDDAALVLSVPAADAAAATALREEGWTMLARRP